MLSLSGNQLIEQGYQRFESEPSVLCFYQKRICNPEGVTLYFLNIFQYSAGWQPEVQFYLPGRIPFNVTAWTFETLEEVEQFFQRVYGRLECEPYEE